MDKLRIGLAGLGHGSCLLQANLPFGRLPVATYGELPLRVTGLCDLDARKLASAAQEYEVPYTTTDFNELSP